MKININTNHIRICKLLGYTSYKTTDFISQFLKMHKQNVNLYIKQIYSFTDSIESKVTIQNMINSINENKGILELLKKEQSFTKENRIFYIILILLRDRYINLNNLSNLLGVSRRILGNDLTLAKESLAKYSLEISSSNAKGISISGNEKNIKLASLSYLYKLFIEFDELPCLITSNYSNFFEDKFRIKLNRDLDIFISEYQFDYFSQNKKLLKAFFIVYGNIDRENEKTIDSLSFSQFKRYFEGIVNESKLNSLYNFLQVSFLGKILLKNIDIFIPTLKFCNGSLKDKDLILSKEVNTVKALVFKNLSILINKTNFLEKLIHKLSLSRSKSLILPICDLEFLKFNLTENEKLKCLHLFFTLRKIYANIQFSNVIFLYIWSSHENHINSVKNTIVVFDSIPQFLFPIIKNRLLLKENMNILEFIKPYEVDKYLSNSDTDCVITFEDLNSKYNYPFIKTYKLPIL